VQPELRATISAKVTGRILEIHAVPGQEVVADELLARIETPQLEAALERAEATLANATSESARYKTLRDSGSISEREIDRVDADLRIATAERNQIRSLLDDATVRAPFAGRITSKALDTGDLVQPGTAICRIEDPTRLRLEIHLAEALASGLKLGQTFGVRIDSAGLGLEGTVAEVAPAADSASRTFLVKLDLPDGKQALSAGQFGRALIPRGTRATLVVPPAAILTRGQLSYVAVVGADQLARLRIVRTGTNRDEGTEILAGLESGERIVAEIPRDLASGTPVHVTP
jgi:RND family efflux transporter MFP subunit